MCFEMKISLFFMKHSFFFLYFQSLVKRVTTENERQKQRLRAGKLENC